MVESNRLPVRGNVTGGAILAEGPIVMIIFLVAGVTIRGGALENAVKVTFLAVDCGMGAGQGEIQFRVVESNRFPIRSDVAGSAVLAKSACMMVIFLMAGKASGWGVF